MPAGGELHVKTENYTLDEPAANEYPFHVEPGNYVRVSVTDTGLGMDEETQKRVFEPFFTTKGLERGTGLGLASVYGIIKNHGGMINVESAKGKGSTFVFSLPACKKEADGEEKRPTKKIVKGNEAILLVDDEEMIAEVGKNLLQELGYQVSIARGGKAAVNMYRKQCDEIDMVILDMIMPDLGGAETYNRLKKINPDVKVLLSSGYSLDGQANQILESGCDGFIQKPFNLKQLSGKIRDILDNR
jgi:CheY-like chemotaxis protein